MPASSSENFVHIEETLRSSLNGAQKKVDSQIVSSAKRVLLNNIGFQPAKRAYAFEIDSLRSKYIPLNPSQPKLSEEHELLSTPKMTGKNSVGCDGLPHPKTILYPEEKIKLEWRRVHQIGSGLINMGNTCFLNSTLQCLTYTPPLVNYFLSEEHSQTCKQAGFCMMCELQRHIKRCYENSGNAIKPQAILQKLRMIAKHMHWGRQEDAHEFLRYVVDAMQRSSLNGYNKLDKFSKETTVVNQIFGGFLRSQVQCLVCKEKSDTYDPFLDISLEIKSVQSLERAFERYVQPETLDNDNAYMCLKCKRKVPAQKRFSVHKPPNVLTISLKRFDFHKMMGKVSRHIQFPEKLNLRPFMSSKQGEPVYYNLYAVLVHSGYACNSGHYYCYIKSPSKIWYCMNDSLVQQCSASRVLNSEAYLLFYIKSKPSVSQQSNGPLIGPKLPTNHSLGKNFKLVNGLKSHHVNDLGSPIERKVTSSTVIGPHLPNSQHTVSSSTSNNKPLPSNREKVTFGLNPLGVKNQNSGATGNKPRIVMQIKNGKVTTFEKSPNGKSKIVSGGEEKSKSKLVPYGDDSESDSENVHGNQAQQQKKASPVKIPPSASLIEKKKSEPVEIIFDKKLNTTTSVPGNANLLESSKVKGDHSHNRRIDSLNLMGHKSKVPQERSIDKTKSFCDTSGILCVSANHTKLKANSTDSKWQILHQDCAPSPSIGSNSSKDSVNSTSEWHVKDNTPVKSIAKTSGRPCPGWKIEQSTECNNHTKPAISECSSATSNSVSTEEKPTPHNGHHSAHSNISDRGDSVTKSAQIDHMYSNIMMKKDKSEIFNSVRKDKVDVSEKQGLICDNTGEGIKDKHKIKKQKKHKKHKKDYKEYKYQELVNESSSSMDMPVKKHKKKKHKHKKDSDNDSDIKKDGKRKSREEEDHREKRHKSNQDSEEYEWVEKTHKSMDSKPIPVQTWDYHIKDKIDRSKTDHRSEHWDGIKSSRVVEQLEKQSSLGYGSSVSSWEGGRNTVDQEVDLEREKERKRHWSEDYDDDLDRGKTKKVRKHHSEHNLYSHNAFQRAQDMKNEEKNKWNHGSNAHGSHSFTGHNRPFYSSQGHHESHHHGYHNDYRNRDTYNHRGSLKYGRR